LQKALGILVSLVVIVLPSPFANALSVENLSNVLGQSQSTIKVWPADTPVIDCEANGVLLHDLVVRDLQGNVVRETGRSSHIILESTVTNYCSDLDNQLSMTLFEIRDSKGLTVYLTWQNSTIDSNQERVIGSSWLADVEPGSYVARAFHITCLNCSGLFNIESYDLTVLP
jgi:hypothetical protein